MARRKNYHRGPWSDDYASALIRALDEVNVSLGEYIQCDYSTGDCVLKPVDPSRDDIDVEFTYSEAEDSVRAVLRRV
jgi:hypothetical protein